MLEVTKNTSPSYFLAAAKAQLINKNVKRYVDISSAPCKSYHIQLAEKNTVCTGSTKCVATKRGPPSFH